MDRKLVHGGLYRHYKDKWYFVLEESKDSESDTYYVVYFPLYLDNLKLFVREKSMFLGEVENDFPLRQKERFLESGKIDLTFEERLELLRKANRLLEEMGLRIMGE